MEIKHPDDNIKALVLTYHNIDYNTFKHMHVISYCGFNS